MMEGNNPPDTWDTGIEMNSGEVDSMAKVENSMSSLNVNATPFSMIPGQNVFAKEFVPSFGSSTTTTTNSVSQPQSNGDTSEEQTKSENVNPPVANAENSGKVGSTEETMEQDVEAPDEWDVKTEENGSSTDRGGGGPSPQHKVQQRVQEDDDDDDMVKNKGKREKRKDHLNIVFIGHVDAGKSTIGGHIMYLTGQVEKRTLEKYEREAKEKNRETWYLSWALDTNLEERDKGKTVEVGRAYFETDTKHFTILDAPGHKSFVPNMIGGASQADVAVLVISARKGEFETGFERGGQTREHAMLVKTAGVKHLVIVVNKMDDPTVKWEESRFNDIKDKLTPYLKKCGFNPKTDIFYIPVSGLTGYNLKDCNKEICSWYSGPSLIEYLDAMNPVSRRADGPVRLPVVDRYKDMGTIILGKLESGKIRKNQVLTLMPNKFNCVVDTVWAYDEEADEVYPGENVKLKLKNIEEEDASSGFVLCDPDNLCSTSTLFDAQIVIMEHRSIICAGYSAVMHIHTSAEEVSIKCLICLVDRKTNEKSKTRPRFIKQDQIAIVRLEVPGGAICLETFKEFPQMGRFTLRDEGRTIAIGKVLKIIK